MNFLKKCFSRDRDVRDYLSFGLSLAMVVIAILYIAIDGGQLKIQDYSRTLGFLMVLLGALIGILTFFLPFRVAKDYLPLLTLALYAVGTGRQLYLTAYPLADLLTGVNWFGGNLGIYLTFFILFLTASIFEIVLLFLPDRKKND